MEKPPVLLTPFGAREQKLTQFNFWPPCGQNKDKL